MFRSVIAIAVGFLLIILLAPVADALIVRLAPGAFELGGRLDNVPVLLFMQLCVGVVVVLGCYVTARLAPARPMRHALLLGALGVLATAVGTVLGWEQLPPWYHVVSIALIMPYAWLGGRVREAELMAGDAPVFAL